jgi:FkbM family methyltransferase
MSNNTTIKLKDRLWNTNDNLFLGSFRAGLIYLGFMLSKLYSSLNLDEYYIFRRIYFFFYYRVKLKLDKKNTDIIKKYIKDQGIFLDIGSAYGFYAKFVNNFKKNKKIISIEPDKICIKYLKDLKLPQKQYKILELGAYNQNKNLKLFTCSENRGENSIHRNNAHDGYKIIKLKKLDNLFKNEKITFMKIDIQGSEPYCLMGAKNILIKNKLCLLIEYCNSNLKDNNLKNFNMINYLKKLNFKITRLDNQKTVKTLNDLKDIKNNRKQCDLFCQN